MNEIIPKTFSTTSYILLHLLPYLLTVFFNRHCFNVSLHHLQLSEDSIHGMPLRDTNDIPHGLYNLYIVCATTATTAMPSKCLWVFFLPQFIRVAHTMFTDIFDHHAPVKSYDLVDGPISRRVVR